MRVLMLGWEFPPFISGGLGTACYGLTRALDAAGHEVLFVLPKSVGSETTSHVRLISPETAPGAGPAGADEAGSVGVGGEPSVSERSRRVDGGPGSAEASDPSEPAAARRYMLDGFEQAEFLGVPSTVTSPYVLNAGEAVGRSAGSATEGVGGVGTEEEAEALRRAGVWVPDEWEARPARGAEPRAGGGRSIDPNGGGGAGGGAGGAHYAGDVVAAADAYARMVVRLCAHERFDVIHAHDWMTYPAGLAMASLTGRPLVAHIHSTEFDRSGEHVNQPVYDIERRGMHGAMHVIAVSALTKSIVAGRYHVPAERVHVVYNGIESNGGAVPRAAQSPTEGIAAKDKIVLFLGRITQQKGPEYFVHAAKRVLEKMDNVKFLVAGSGDMAVRMIELAAQLGIGHKVLFTGFLRGADVERVFRMADLYVMPSVSEPFGIAPLEAITNGTPVIISKQSGVSEVLRHALKVDFWDTQEMANKIVAVLKHPPLQQMLRDHGAFEVRGLTWEGAARKVGAVYDGAVRGVGGGGESRA